MLLALCASGRADVMESARMLPDDTMVMISVESVSGLRAAMEKTSLYGLYKDPAMQEFVTETEKKVRELISTKLKEFWKEMEIENPPEQLPYPEGRLVLGFSLFKSATSADADNKRSDVGFRFVVLADMGSRVELARQIVKSLIASAAEEGEPLEKKTMGGVELNVVVPDAGSNDPTVHFGFKDNWLVVIGDTTREVAFPESIVRRMGHSVPGSLADKAGLKSAVKSLGDAQIYSYINIDPAKALLMSRIPDKAQAERIIKTLGLQNVTGMTVATQIAGQRNQEMTSRLLIGIDGPKTGVPALLSGGAGPMKLNNHLLTRNATGFVCAYYEPVKVFDAIAKIVQDVAFMDLNMLIAPALQATAGEGGQPPVHLRDDVLAQTGGPLFATWQVDKPYNFSGITKFIMSLSVKDAGRLNVALGRIHGAFLGTAPEMRRDLLDHTLYLLPTDEPEMEDTDSNSPGGEIPAKEDPMAFSVAGDSLVFGPVDEVEQAIRSAGKTPENPINSDPLFRYAHESLPAQASVYFYRNDRLNAEAIWTTLRQMARDVSTQDGGSFDPMMMGMREIKKYVDLGKLPEFKAVEKYWGASVGYMQSRPEGLYWESVTLRPPQQ